MNLFYHNKLERKGIGKKILFEYNNNAQYKFSNVFILRKVCNLQDSNILINKDKKNIQETHKISNQQKEPIGS